MFDITKPIQTRDGRPVRILCTDAPCSSQGNLQPIVGLIEKWAQPVAWSQDGSYHGPGVGQSDLDLINVPPKMIKVKVEVRLSRRADGSMLSTSIFDGETFPNGVLVTWDDITGADEKHIATSTFEMEYEDEQT